MRIHFILVSEGSSDDGLIPHLENLCIELGADEVTGTAVDYQRLQKPIESSVEAKLRAAIRLEPEANLIFVHRDADHRDPAPRYSEIAAAIRACDLDRAWVPLVPVQETEAWLLLDEAAIRSVAGRPRGQNSLDLPHPRQVEAVANPKERLKEALVQAAELAGRRLAKFRRDFPSHRRLLLQRLPIDGLLSQINSWTGFKSRLAETIQKLIAATEA